MKNKNDDESLIDLRSEKGDEEAEFQVTEIEEEEEVLVEAPVKPVKKMIAAQEEDLDLNNVRTSTMVKIKFEKFINLLSKYDFETLISMFSDQEIIIGTDLLSDLANPPVDKEEKPSRLPYYLFGIGLVLGIFLTWVLLKS